MHAEHGGTGRAVPSNVIRPEENSDASLIVEGHVLVHGKVQYSP